MQSSKKTPKPSCPENDKYIKLVNNLTNCATGRDESSKEPFFIKVDVAGNLDNIFLDIVNNITINYILKQYKSSEISCFAKFIDCSMVSLRREKQTDGTIEYFLGGKREATGYTVDKYCAKMLRQEFITGKNLNLFNYHENYVVFQKFDIYIHKLFQEIQFLGETYGFFHGELDLSNVIFDGKKFVIIDYSRVLFNDTIVQAALNESQTITMIQNGKNSTNETSFARYKRLTFNGYDTTLYSYKQSISTLALNILFNNIATFGKNEKETYYVFAKSNAYLYGMKTENVWKTFVMNFQISEPPDVNTRTNFAYYLDKTLNHTNLNEQNNQHYYFLLNEGMNYFITYLNKYMQKKSERLLIKRENPERTIVTYTIDFTRVKQLDIMRENFQYNPPTMVNKSAVSPVTHQPPPPSVASSTPLNNPSWRIGGCKSDLNLVCSKTRNKNKKC